MLADRTARHGWVKYLVLVILVAAGGAGRLYLSGAWFSSSSEPIACPGPEPEPASVAHRFALTALDAKDQIEAPELATDSAGRVYLVWASQTGEAERTVFLTSTDDRGATFAGPRPAANAGIGMVGVTSRSNRSWNRPISVPSRVRCAFARR